MGVPRNARLGQADVAEARRSDGVDELGGAGHEADATATDVVVGGVRYRAPLMEAHDQEESTDPGKCTPRFRNSACRAKGNIPSCRHPARFRSL